MRRVPASLQPILLASALSFAAPIDFAGAQTDDRSSDAITAERVTVRRTEPREFDWAKLQARARVAYVSSGSRILTSRMIDNDIETAFRFSPSDSSPTVIVELAKVQALHRVTALFKG